MPALDDTLLPQLKELESQHRLRSVAATQHSNGPCITIGNTKYYNFSSNNYFGFCHHEEVIAAAQEAISRYGAGAGASRLVSGNTPLYATLEATLAEVKKQQAACVFGSGYLANIGAITALMEGKDLILIDRLAHASIYDAVRMSGATWYRFKHNDMDHLEDLLKKHRSAHRHCMIVTETLFSMDGDRAPMKDIGALKQAYDAWLMADDAHGFGIIPHEASIDIYSGTLSKALGSYGGYVASSQAVIDYMHNKARSVIYSTALPPAALAAAQKSLALWQKDPDIAHVAVNHARAFAHALSLPEVDGPIVPYILKHEERALEAAHALREHQCYVQAIRPPTVPSGTSRLRCTFMAQHTSDMVETLTHAIKAYVHSD